MVRVRSGAARPEGDRLSSKKKLRSGIADRSVLDRWSAGSSRKRLSGCPMILSKNDRGGRPGGA